MSYHLPLSRYTRRKETRRIIIHCAATPPGFNGGSLEIRPWHADPKPRGNGWIDIGYHLVIKRDGTLNLGRPLWAVGAHVGGHNHDSIGICLVGGVAADGKTPQNNFLPSQWATLRDILPALLTHYPGCTVTGHNRWDRSKDCPSFDVERWYRETFTEEKLINLLESIAR